MATRNWSTGNTALATGLGGTITDTDDWLFEEGADYIQTQLAQSALDLESIQIRSDVSIGWDGSAVVGTMLVDIANSADAYLLHAGAGHVRVGAGTGGTITNVYAQMKAQGLLYLGAGAYTKVDCESGLTTFASDADPATLNVAGVSARAQVLGASGGTAITGITVVKGTAWISRDFATLNVGDGATVEIDGDFITPVTINQYGGRIEYNGGDIGTLNGYGGVFSRLKALRDVAIGTAFTGAPTWQFIKSDRAATTVSGTSTPIGSGAMNPVV